MLADSSCPNRLRVLRSQGLPAKGLFEVYRGVVIAKLLYAASAWWGFTSADDKQRLAAFIRRSVRQDKAFVLQTLLILLISYTVLMMTCSNKSFLTQITSLHLFCLIKPNHTTAMIDNSFRNSLNFMIV